MSVHELILILLASGILYGVLARHERRWLRNLLLVVTIVPGHSEFEAIEHQGGDRYRDWQDRLYFSTPDNSNPNTNGRDY